jgi:hypothetical protein
MATEVVIPGQKAGYDEGGLKLNDLKGKPDITTAVTNAVVAVATQPGKEVTAAMQANIATGIPLPQEEKPQG